MINVDLSNRVDTFATHRLVSRFTIVAILALELVYVSASFAAERSGSVEQLLARVKAVDVKGAGHAEAKAAVKLLSMSEGNQLLTIIAGIDGANPLAVNWLRSAVESVADRERTAGRKLPQTALEKYVLDTSHGDRSRRLAYEILANVDTSAPQRLLPKMIEDSSLELRRDALAQRIDQLAAAGDAKLPAAELLTGYRQLMAQARDPDQIKLLSEKLKELGEPVDLPRHFGFIMEWKLIAPFDNVESRGYAVAYPPEQSNDSVPAKYKASYPGKKEPVTWFDHATSDDYGAVDLNKVVGKHMGAVAYAEAEFQSDKARPVDLRLGSGNACKIWLNGKQVFEREVYHSNSELDQYLAQGTLKPGVNTILVKVCQNEQTEEWAQDWQFQLRVCDERGAAVLSTKRPPTPKKPLDSDSDKKGGDKQGDSKKEGKTTKKS